MSKLRLVARNDRPSQSKMLSMSLPSSSTSASRSRAPRQRSLGDKLQLLALLRPGLMMMIERVVDRLIEQERTKKEGR